MLAAPLYNYYCLIVCSYSFGRLSRTWLSTQHFSSKDIGVYLRIQNILSRIVNTRCHIFDCTHYDLSTSPKNYIQQLKANSTGLVS